MNLNLLSLSGSKAVRKWAAGGCGFGHGASGLYLSAASSHYTTWGSNLPLIYSTVRASPASFPMLEALENSCILLDCSRNFLLHVVLHHGEPRTELLENRPAGRLALLLNLSLTHSQPARVPHMFLPTRRFPRKPTVQAEEGSWGWSTLCRDLPPVTAPATPVWKGHLQLTAASPHCQGGWRWKVREILLCRAFAQRVSAVGAAKCPLLWEGMWRAFFGRGKHRDSGDTNSNAAWCESSSLQHEGIYRCKALLLSLLLLLLNLM